MSGYAPERYKESDETRALKSASAFNRWERERAQKEGERAFLVELANDANLRTAFVGMLLDASGAAAAEVSRAVENVTDDQYRILGQSLKALLELDKAVTMARKTRPEDLSDEDYREMHASIPSITERARQRRQAAAAFQGQGIHNAASAIPVPEGVTAHEVTSGIHTHHVEDEYGDFVPFTHSHHGDNEHVAP